MVHISCGETNADSTDFIERFRASVARVIRHPKLKEKHVRDRKSVV